MDAVKFINAMKHVQAFKPRDDDRQGGAVTPTAQPNNA